MLRSRDRSAPPVPPTGVTQDAETQQGDHFWAGRAMEDAPVLAQKPRRPLSAYNLFFRAQREAMLNDEGPEVSHGKVTFKSLAKTVAAKWREIDPSEKEKYERTAAVGRAEYVKKTKLWKQQQRILAREQKKNLTSGDGDKATTTAVTVVTEVPAEAAIPNRRGRHRITNIPERGPYCDSTQVSFAGMPEYQHQHHYQQQQQQGSISVEYYPPNRSTYREDGTQQAPAIYSQLHAVESALLPPIPPIPPIQPARLLSSFNDYPSAPNPPAIPPRMGFGVQERAMSMPGRFAMEDTLGTPLMPGGHEASGRSVSLSGMMMGGNTSFRRRSMPNSTLDGMMGGSPSFRRRSMPNSTLDGSSLSLSASAVPSQWATATALESSRHNEAPPSLPFAPSRNFLVVPTSAARYPVVATLPAQSVEPWLDEWRPLDGGMEPLDPFSTDDPDGLEGLFE